MADGTLIIVTGSRWYDDYVQFALSIDQLLSEYPGPYFFFNGDSGGVDRMCTKYCAERAHRVQLFPAKWEDYGKSAGPIRNNQMAREAFDRVASGEVGNAVTIAFWDQKSRGTKNMMDLSVRYDIPVRRIDI